MGLRDRLRLLVRPAPETPRARPAAAPLRDALPTPPPLWIPRPVPTVPLGATLVQASLAPEKLAALQGLICVTSPEDSGRAASAVAERLCARGVQATWLSPEPS